MIHVKEGGRDFWQILQTIVLTATAAGLFLSVGRRAQEISAHSGQISELREITMDLVKAQVLGQANDNSHMRVLDELKRRIERLENEG